ncbi:AI-2E family transporter [Candidatus Daviesbacteria bacterium]|nr:AI-2E family transporter [Candidatus Daviesbacteria bacterium]
MTQKIDISHKTVIFIAIFLVSLWLTYLVKDLLIIIFVAIILMSALHPLVNFFTKFKIYKGLAIGLTYIIIITAITGMVLAISKPLIEESNKLASTFPATASQLLQILNIDRSIVQSEVGSLSRNLFSLTLAVFDNLLTIIFLLVITFYLLLEKDSLEKRIASFFVKREEKTRKLLVQIEDKLGAWLRGQLFLSLIIGLLSYIGLLVLNIPYALPLSLLAAVFEIIPVIGPIVSAIPAVLIALTISPILALGVVAMYFIIQQLENHLIVPQVMQRAVGLNPLVVILAIAIGSRILGFAGALLAVPLAVVLQIVVAEIISEKKL